jgi:hypothetical protein
MRAPNQATALRHDRDDTLEPRQGHPLSSSDEEAFAVLEWMIAEGRISVRSVCATAQLPTAA